MNKLIILLCLAIVFISHQTVFGYTSGTGTMLDPYIIGSEADLATLSATSADWDKCFRLDSDLVLPLPQTYAIQPIGNYPNAFTGFFDGNGHAITNLSIVDVPAGLFGRLTGSVVNLGLINADIVGEIQSGAIVAENFGGTVSGCYAVGNVSGTTDVGVLVGFNNYGGIITNCSASGIASGTSAVGGLVGANYGSITNCYSYGIGSGQNATGGLAGYNNGIITDCYVFGDSNGTVDFTGGLVGRNDGQINNCFTTGNVAGANNTGGLVGQNNYGLISNSYATGNVIGATITGGLVGANNYGEIVNCYSIGNVTGTTDTGGLVGLNMFIQHTTDSFWNTQTSGQSTSSSGTGKTMAQMKTAATFTNANWDFATVWVMTLGASPKLQLSQSIPGDINSDGIVDFLDLRYLAENWLISL